MTNEHLKRYSALLAIRECKFKPQIQALTNTFAWKKLKRLTIPSSVAEFSYIACGSKNHFRI